MKVADNSQWNKSPHRCCEGLSCFSMFILYLCLKKNF